MSEHIHVKTHCPNCNYVNSHMVELKRYMPPAIVYCDCDDGPGCGERYVIHPKITATAEVFEIVPVEEKK